MKKRQKTKSLIPLPNKAKSDYRSNEIFPFNIPALKHGEGRIWAVEAAEEKKRESQRCFLDESQQTNNKNVLQECKGEQKEREKKKAA